MPAPAAVKFTVYASNSLCDFTALIVNPLPLANTNVLPLGLVDTVNVL